MHSRYYVKLGQDRKRFPMHSKPGIGEKVNDPVKQKAGREFNKAEKDLAQCGNQVAGL